MISSSNSTYCFCNDSYLFFHLSRSLVIAYNFEAKREIASFTSNCGFDEIFETFSFIDDDIDFGDTMDVTEVVFCLRLTSTERLDAISIVGDVRGGIIFTSTSISSMNIPEFIAPKLFPVVKSDFFGVVFGNGVVISNKGSHSSIFDPCL